MNAITPSATTTGAAPHIDEQRAQFPFVLVALTVVVVVFGVVGVFVAALTFASGGDSAATDHAASPEVGAAINTSFGSIFVEQVETLEGLSEEQLGGMTHGIADLVTQDDAKVSIAVLLVNRSKSPVAVDTGDYAIFVDGAPNPIPPSSSTIQPLALAPGSSVAVTVTFVVPRTDTDISMGYADPDGSVIVVPVGRVDQAPPVDPTDDHTTPSGDGDHHDDHDH